MGFQLPNPVDPNWRTAPGDPEYGLHAFGSAWHDLWTFFTTIAQDLYRSFRTIEYLSDRT